MFLLTRGSFFRFSSRRLFASSSSRSRLPSLRRGHTSRTWFLSLRRGHPSRTWFLPLRGGHPSRTRSPFLGGSHASRCSPFFRRGHPGRTRSPSLGVGFFNGATLESFLPPTALGLMVPFIELAAHNAHQFGVGSNRDTLDENSPSNEDFPGTTHSTSEHTRFRVSRYRWEHKRNTGPIRIEGRKSNTGCHSKTSRRCNRPTAY